MTVHTWQVSALLRTHEPQLFARRAGDRLLALASGLDARDTLELRLSSAGDGAVGITVSCRSDCPDLDALVSWVWEDVADVEPVSRASRLTVQRVTELVAAVRHPVPNVWAELEPDEAPATHTDLRNDVWPAPVLRSGIELLKALRATRAEIRLHLAPASEIAAQMAEHEARRSTLARDPGTFVAYLGTPVSARLLVGHDGSLSPRLRAALLAHGIGLRLRDLDTESLATREAWAGELDALRTDALPFGAAQCLTVITAAGSGPGICGVPTREPVAAHVPIADDQCRTGLRLGKARTTGGGWRDVRLGRDDLLLHTQLTGSTGAGKSSLLAALVREARDEGIGVSVIDPHGHLVDRILAETQEHEAASVLAVRSGDLDRPVPLNPFAGRNPELMADVMVAVLRELHDPGNQGFMGPVWERWFAACMHLQRALIGPRATMSLLPEIVQDQERLATLLTAMRRSHSSAGRDMWPLVSGRAEEFAETSTWFTSKFQRLVGSPQMRAILGSGHDAVDVVDVIDGGGMLLIDLAAPVVGDLGAQLLGEMWLAKHWEALAQRADPTAPHLLVVDEAHLFASGLLPRLLTQARKFGVAVVAAHQNLEQLTPSLREALASSTNNAVVFRTGHREAASSSERLGSWSGGSLTRLPRLSATCTLSSGGVLTDAFTLVVDHNERAVRADDEVARGIVERTKATVGLADADESRLSFSVLRRQVTGAAVSAEREKVRRRLGLHTDDSMDEPVLQAGPS